MKKPKLTKAYAGYLAACEILNGKTFNDALAVARSRGMHVEGIFEDEKMFDVWAGKYCIVTFRDGKVQTHGLDVWADEEPDEEIGDTDTHIGLIDVGDENYVWHDMSNPLTACFVRVQNEDEQRTVVEKLYGMGRDSELYDTDDRYMVAVAGRNNFTSFRTEEEVRKLCKDYIDCGTDTDLFLALAAMNDRNDRNQWFVFTRDVYDMVDEFVSGDVQVAAEGEFYFCRDHEMVASTARKATAEEVVEYYRKKREQERESSISTEPQGLNLDLYVKKMTPVEFVRLRRACVNLVRETVKTEYDEKMQELFEQTAARSELLPFTGPVARTFMGIIGFRHYLQQQGPNPGYFAREATHDLNECVKNFNEEWYSPRTEDYARFYEPLPVEIADERSPADVVTRFLDYMKCRWCEEECKLVFRWNYRHFWEKWCHIRDMYKRGAGECFFAELDMENKRLLVERAIRYYDENLNETVRHRKNLLP